MMRLARFVIAAWMLLMFGAQADAQDITTGLIGHWKLTETSGTVATDSSGFGRNGTYTNSPALATSVACPVDGAISAKFDGVNDYVAIGSEASFDLTGSMTVAIWIRVDLFDTAWQDILTKGDSNSWRLLRDNTNNGVTFACSGLSTLRVSSVKVVNDSKWHHVCGVYTGSQLRIYIDGVLDNSVSSSGTILTNNFAVQIAQNAEAGNRNFDGALYDARIYNRALSVDDVMYLYALGGPIGRWKQIETSGTVATDSSVCQNNGTYTSGPVVNQTGPFPGPGDKAVTYDGTDDYALISNITNYQITSKLTMAAWIRGDTWQPNGSSVNVILRKGDANPNNYQFAIADSKVALFLDDSDTGGIRGNTVLSTGVWYHVAATWDGSNVRLYVNGVLDNTVARTGTIATDTRALSVGGRPGASGDQFDGQLHDVLLYNRALSSSEIGELYGKVGHWKLADASGTTAVDSSPFVKNGTVTGGASWSTRCNGTGVFDFNGSTQYISTTNASQLQPETGIAVAAWVKADAWGTGSEVDPILRKGEASPNNYQLAITDGKVTLYLDDTDGAGIKGNTVLTVGEWYHVAATWDGSLVKIFVNGQLDNTPVARTAAIATDTRPLYIGGRSGADLFDGQLYDVRFYNRAIYPSEIAELFGLIAHWKLDESSGSTASDSSNTARNASVVGTSTWVTTGVVNGCFSFNGSTKIQIADLMTRPKNVTLAGWARLTTADSGGADLVTIGDCALIRLDSSGATSARFYNGSSYVAASVNQTFAGGSWHHFAAVFDDDQNYCRLYLDGVQVANTSTTSAVSYSGQGSNTIIGAHGNGATTLDFNGKVDDVRIYNRALCASEIQALKDQGVIPGARILNWVEIP